MSGVPRVTPDIFPHLTHKDLLLCNSGDDLEDVQSSSELDLAKIPGYDTFSCNTSLDLYL